MRPVKPTFADKIIVVALGAVLIAAFSVLALALVMSGIWVWFAGFAAIVLVIAGAWHLVERARE